MNLRDIIQQLENNNLPEELSIVVTFVVVLFLMYVTLLVIWYSFKLRNSQRIAEVDKKIAAV